MKRDASIYLRDILENMERAVRFVGELDYEEFKSDEKTFYAVIRCIEIIGEASKNLPDTVKKQHPGIPWRDMAGMRDKTIHSYFGVNPIRVWQVVKEDLPELKPDIMKALKGMKKSR